MGANRGWVRFGKGGYLSSSVPTRVISLLGTRREARELPGILAPFPWRESHTGFGKKARKVGVEFRIFPNPFGCLKIHPWWRAVCWQPRPENGAHMYLPDSGHLASSSLVIELGVCCNKYIEPFDLSGPLSALFFDKGTGGSHLSLIEF
jgi:hypothetical protein